MIVKWSRILAYAMGKYGDEKFLCLPVTPFVYWQISFMSHLSLNLLSKFPTIFLIAHCSVTLENLWTSLCRHFPKKLSAIPCSDELMIFTKNLERLNNDVQILLLWIWTWRTMEYFWRQTFSKSRVHFTLLVSIDNLHIVFLITATTSVPHYILVAC